MLALVLLPFPALADRTGKYSTKLTAKRRYVPRITRGAEAVLSATAEDSVVDDMLTAMSLFATTYFSEGNRISSREKSLQADVDRAREALRELASARRVAAEDRQALAIQMIREAVESWLRTADFKQITGVDLLK